MNPEVTEDLRPQSPYEFTEDWFSMHIPTFQRHLGPLAGTPCRLLEIGSHEGRATTWLADHILTHREARLDTIDPQPPDRLRRNIARTGRASQIGLHVNVSRKVLRHLPLSTYDFIYVDGSHGTVDVLEDAVSSYQLTRQGGIIAFDDYPWDVPALSQEGVPGPAIDAFLSLYANPSRYNARVELIEAAWQVWVRRLASD